MDDFEKHYAEYHLPDWVLASLNNGMVIIDFIYETAKHFYELGQKDAKEDNE